MSFLEFYGAVLNTDGEVAFRAKTSDGASGIWAGPQEDLSLVAREGLHAPGTGSGVTFRSFDDPALASAGLVAFSARLSGPSVTSDNDWGIWVGTPGNLAVVARTGEHAPGTPSGDVFASFIDRRPALNPAGVVAFRGTLDGTSVTDANRTGLWAGQAGALTLVARAGGTAPGTSEHFSSLGRPVLNAGGQVAFHAQLNPTVVYVPGPPSGWEVTYHPGVWLGPPANPGLVARDGDDATAGGLWDWKYVSFGDPSINGSGEVAFRTSIAGHDKFEQAILAGDPGDLDLVAWTGAGTTYPPEFSYLWHDPVLNDAGEVAFLGRIPDGGRTVLRAGPRSNPSSIAVQDFPAPGVPGDARFQSFSDVTFNEIGVVSFRARLTGGDVTHADDEGVWAGSWKVQAPSKLNLLAREGDSVEVSPGVLKEISVLTLNAQSGNADGLSSAFNDASRQVLGCRFTEGTQAVLSAGLRPPLAGFKQIAHPWETVSFPIMLAEPIVIIGPPTLYDSGPGVIRLRKVTGAGFDVRFQEWRYLDGNHSNETLSYLALEDGRRTLPDGSTWEAGAFDLGGTGTWEQISFEEPFEASPVVLLTVQTFNGSDPVTVRARGVGPAGFEAALFEEEALMNGHVVERVGYLAIHSPGGSGDIDVADVSTPYVLQRQTVDHQFTPVLSSAIKVEEEQSQDPEVNHTGEAVSVLGMGRFIFAQIATSNGPDTAALRWLVAWRAGVTCPCFEWGTVSEVNHTWTTVPLARAYRDAPVVVAKPVSDRGPQPGVVRVRNVTTTSFQVRVQEWKYLDGWHQGERVFYLVADVGRFGLDGLDVEAGKLTTNLLVEQGWQRVQFPLGFSSNPAVFAGVMTANGPDPVLTRVKDSTSQGFSISMSEEEALGGNHVRETLGWIAVESGATVLANNSRRVVATHVVASDQPTTTPFGVSAARRFPFIVGDIVSANGTDPVFLRYRDLTSSSVTLFLDEEQSADQETSHVEEDVSLFVAE